MISVVVVVCSLGFGLFFFSVLIFCSKNGEFTSRNSFCLETDHLKDTCSREQCAGKLNKANLGVENRGDQDVLALSSFPSLAGGSLTLKAGEGAARFQID